MGVELRARGEGCDGRDHVGMDISRLRARERRLGWPAGELLEVAHAGGFVERWGERQKLRDDSPDLKK